MRNFFKVLGAICLLAVQTALYAAPSPGNGWAVKEIAPGIVYYTFSGIDEVSGSAQQVFVIDLDLSNPEYAVRFSYSRPETVTSEVYHREKALVTMNAAYEPSSIVIKVDGTMYSCMPHDVVFSGPVPNWKSEGAIYTDGGQNVRIGFDGKGKSIAEQRDFWASSREPNILSSAPMLIDDYDPVGASFVDTTLLEDINSLHYEDPTRHQGVRHPRSAVAKTADNHLLLVAVDGRRKNLSEGMNARELTLFLARNFNPQYALNMDGGGSTTLCVAGEGDTFSNVVNYPTDNKKYDHAGERKLTTHICIVRAADTESLKGDSAQPEGLQPRVNVRQEVLADWNKSSGLDCVYDLSPKASTPAPKGYEPVYISHYGRHGSRYAYTANAYTVPLDMLRQGADEGNLTPLGARLLKDLSGFWELAQYQVGDLAPLGWEQHRQIARTMVSSFPSAFKEGSRVDACSSPSIRSIISMSSSMASISREAPKTTVYAHQGTLDVQATRPNNSKNPFRYQGPTVPFPYPESSSEFFLRKFPGYRDVLSRLFDDADKGLGNRDPYDVFFNLYMFVGGMNSLPEDVRIDVDGIFTKEEYATLWEIDNYERFREYFAYRAPCSSIVEDIVFKADERLSGGERGADMRFGHDHVVMSLLMIMDIDGFDYHPASADDLPLWFQTFRSPMGANIQIVFYRPKCRRKDGETLVKVLLNGEEARFGGLAPKDGPYYEWSALREWLLGRVDHFVSLR